MTTILQLTEDDLTNNYQQKVNDPNLDFRVQGIEMFRQNVHDLWLKADNVIFVYPMGYQILLKQRWTDPNKAILINCQSIVKGS
jgi:hypothetical protein